MKLSDIQFDAIEHARPIVARDPSLKDRKSLKNKKILLVKLPEDAQSIELNLLEKDFAALATFLHEDRKAPKQIVLEVEGLDASLLGSRFIGLLVKLQEVLYKKCNGRTLFIGEANDHLKKLLQLSKVTPDIIKTVDRVSKRVKDSSGEIVRQMFYSAPTLDDYAPAFMDAAPAAGASRSRGVDVSVLWNELKSDKHLPVPALVCTLPDVDLKENYQKILINFVQGLQSGHWSYAMMAFNLYRLCHAPEDELEILFDKIIGPLQDRLKRGNKNVALCNIEPGSALDEMFNKYMVTHDFRKTGGPVFHDFSSKEFKEALIRACL